MIVGGEVCESRRSYSVAHDLFVFEYYGDRTVCKSTVIPFAMCAKQWARRVGQSAGERNLLIQRRYGQPAAPEKDLQSTMFAATRWCPVQLELGLQLFRHRGEG